MESSAHLPPLSEPDLADGAVKLRRWHLSDRPLVRQASRDEELLAGTTLPRNYSAAEGRAFIERQWSRSESGEGLSLAIEADGVAVGSVTLMIRRPTVGDLGFWLLQKARGHGIGGTAVGLFVSWALGQDQLEAIEAFVREDNTPSRRLLERLGFEHVGKRRHVVNDLDAELLVYRLGRHQAAE